MPLDNRINTDIKRLYDKHCVVTYRCKNTGINKFSMAALRLIARGICQLVENKEEGVPNSELICHDCDKALDIMYTCYLANGDIAAELADCNGGHYSRDGTGKHGGVRKKGDINEEQWLDPYTLNTNIEKIFGLLPVKLNMLLMIVIHHCLAPVNCHAHRRI